MKDSKLQFDRSCHVLYSKPCKKEIQKKIVLHYPETEREAVWERVQRQYADYLAGWRTDLGGKKNFHNGAGGNYDCVALMAYYVVCKEVTSLAEIEEMEGNLFLPTFRILSKFVDCNKPLFFTPYSVAVLASNGCFSHAAASERFAYQPRPVEETLRDMTVWLLNQKGT